MDNVVTIQSETKQISKDLRELYDAYKGKQISRKAAETLANIAGKNLRAQAILLIEEQSVNGMKKVP